MNKKEQKLYDLAVELGDDIAAACDKYLYDMEAREVITVLGYAVNLLVQGFALQCGTDPETEVVCFAEYLKMVSKTIVDKNKQN